MDTDNKDAISKAAVEIVKPIYDDALAPGAKQIGKTLETVGRAINIAFEPVRLIVSGLEQLGSLLEDRLTRRLSHLKPEEIMPPPPNVAVPAIEALRYNMDQKVLREMFISLVASSMDPSTSEQTHPAYVEVVKQLSPKDASALMLFDPGSENILQASFGEYIRKQEPVISEDLSFLAGIGPHEIPLIIGSLERLGLVSTQTFSFKGNYNKSRSTITVGGDHHGWIVSPIWGHDLEQRIESSLTTAAASVAEFGGLVTIAALTLFGKRFYDVAVRPTLTSAQRD